MQQFFFFFFFFFGTGFGGGFGGGGGGSGGCPAGDASHPWWFKQWWLICSQFYKLLVWHLKGWILDEQLRLLCLPYKKISSHCAFAQALCSHRRTSGVPLVPSQCAIIQPVCAHRQTSGVSLVTRQTWPCPVSSQPTPWSHLT